MYPQIQNSGYATASASIKFEVIVILVAIYYVIRKIIKLALISIEQNFAIDYWFWKKLIISEFVSKVLWEVS